MLYRGKWDECRGRATYGELTISRSYSDALEPLPICEGTGSSLLADSERFTPLFYELGMEPRRFLGPEVMPGVRLFPAEGLTTISALGASGKTTFIVNIGAHIAAGRDWNGAKVSQRRVAIFSVEETQDELNRKFSATVEDWADSDRFEAIKNLRLISLQGVDARLTQITGRQVEAGGFSDEVINFCRGFGLEDGVIFLDHYQGLVSGDLNLSDTATGFCREANKIAVTLKSAVVILSHTSKQNMSISSADITQGHSSGSLAFENAMRQTIVTVAMTKDEAKNYGLDESDLRYVWLGLPKNSYGSTNAGVWMEKCLSQRFHTIRFDPVALEKLKKRPSQTGEERIRSAIVDYVREHPWKTKNAIEKVAGMKSRFRASSKSVRSCMEGLLAEDILCYHTVGVEERNKYGLAKQVREVLRVSA